MKLQGWLSGLYEADTRRGHRFRYGLLLFDLTTILFIVTQMPFISRHASRAARIQPDRPGTASAATRLRPK